MNQPVATKALTPEQRRVELRKLGDALWVWRLCARQACRRAQRCRGEPRRCLPLNMPLIPEDARIFMVAIVAEKERGLSFDEATAAVAGSEISEAYAAWIKAAGAPRRRPRKPRWQGPPDESVSRRRPL